MSAILPCVLSCVYDSYEVVDGIIYFLRLFLNIIHDDSMHFATFMYHSLINIFIEKKAEAVNYKDIVNMYCCDKLSTLYYQYCYANNSYHE